MTQGGEFGLTVQRRVSVPPYHCVQELLMHLHSGLCINDTLE